MRAQKERLTIDAVAMLIYTMQENQSKKKLAKVLFIDIKGTFDQLSKSQLLTHMIDLAIHTNLVLQTKFFLTYKKIQLVIDKNTNKEKEIETGIF